jgi:hypothetical protein
MIVGLLAVATGELGWAPAWAAPAPRAAGGSAPAGAQVGDAVATAVLRPRHIQQGTQHRRGGRGHARSSAPAAQPRRSFLAIRNAAIGRADLP